jgi:uncharacterized protein YjbI with pentapeptide repeats
MYQNHQRQGLLLTLSAVLTGVALMTGVGIYVALKSVESPVLTSEASPPNKSVALPDMTQIPVDTTAHTSNIPTNDPSYISQDLPQEQIPVAQAVSKQQNEPRKNLGGVNWSGRNLRGMKLRNANLGGANLENSDFNGVDLSGATLNGANLANADLSHVNLSSANLSGANLDNANLSNANLYSADLRGANLDNANLNGANLKGTLLDGANLSGTTMP